MSSCPGGRTSLDSKRLGSSEREFIRVWRHEVDAYQGQDWRLCCVRRGFPSEALLGPDYADCLLVREVRDDG